MPHRSHALLAAASRTRPASATLIPCPAGRAALALAARRICVATTVLTACGQGGDATVVVRAGAASGAREVVALPFDPASLPPPRSPQVTSTGPHGDSIARAIALRDSAAALDAAFQSARTRLNDDAAAMRGADRRAADYARRYADFERRASDAERTRADRDRLLTRLATFRSRLGDALPATGGSGPSRATVDSAARAGRTVVRAALRDGAGTLSLPPGSWWLALAGADGAPRSPARAMVVRAGATDTVDLTPR